jgi:branched-subunit amino acid transport protein
MTTWIVVIAVGVGSYLLRSLPVLLDARWTSSPQVERVISHAGVAAVAALIVTGLHRGSTSPVATAAVVAAATVALVFSLRRASMLRVLLAGFVVYAVVNGAAALL